MRSNLRHGKKKKNRKNHVTAPLAFWFSYFILLLTGRNRPSKTFDSGHFGIAGLCVYTRGPFDLLTNSQSVNFSVWWIFYFLFYFFHANNVIESNQKKKGGGFLITSTESCVCAQSNGDRVAQLKTRRVIPFSVWIFIANKTYSESPNIIKKKKNMTEWCRLRISATTSTIIIRGIWK